MCRRDTHLSAGKGQSAVYFASPARSQQQQPGPDSSSSLESNIDEDVQGDLTIIEDQWIGKETVRTDIPLFEMTEYELNGLRHDVSRAEVKITSSLPVPKMKDEAKVNEVIKEISYLANYPREYFAMRLMRRLSIAIAPLMRAMGWTVDHLTEFYPDMVELYGLNSYAGEVILIKLRDPFDETLFRPWGNILCSALHELCHNVVGNHGHDFWTLYYDVTTRMGIDEQERLTAFQQIAASPGRPHLFDQVALSTGGVISHIEIADFKKHFSTYADHDNINRNIILLSRKHHPSVIVRLIQLAKGLDPADDKGYFEVTNAADYCTSDNNTVLFRDKYTRVRDLEDDYEVLDPGTDAAMALDLYISMYKAGEDLGWHPSSRRWLLKQLGYLLAWDPRYGNRSWCEPELETSREVTLHLAEMIGQIFLETGPQDWGLRDVAMTVLEQAIDMASQQLQDRFDIEILRMIEAQVRRDDKMAE